MSLIGFIRSVEESQDEFDVELEEFGADSEQKVVDDDASGGRLWDRLFLVALLLVGIAYAVSRLRSSSGDSFAGIALADDPAEGDSAAGEETGTGGDAINDEDATVTVEHGPEAEMDDAAADDKATEANEMGDVSGEETSADNDGAIEVEIESPSNGEE